jgi:hypothetical protein
MSDILAGKTRYPISQFRQQEIAHYEAQPIHLTCAFCSWKFDGTVLKGRAAALKHREKKHPETFDIPRRKRRSARTLTHFRYTNIDSQSIAEIEEERKKRAFLNGVEIAE